MKIDDFKEITERHKEFCINTIRDRSCNHNCNICPFYKSNLKIGGLSCTIYLDVHSTYQIPFHAMRFLKLTRKKFVDIGVFRSVAIMEVDKNSKYGRF